MTPGSTRPACTSGSRPRPVPAGSRPPPALPGLLLPLYPNGGESFCSCPLDAPGDEKVLSFDTQRNNIFPGTKGRHCCPIKTPSKPPRLWGLRFRGDPPGGLSMRFVLTVKMPAGLILGAIAATGMAAAAAKQPDASYS